MGGQCGHHACEAPSQLESRGDAWGTPGPGGELLGLPGRLGGRWVGTCPPVTDPPGLMCAVGCRPAWAAVAEPPPADRREADPQCPVHPANPYPQLSACPTRPGVPSASLPPRCNPHTSPSCPGLHTLPPALACTEPHRASTCLHGVPVPFPPSPLVAVHPHAHELVHVGRQHHVVGVQPRAQQRL